MTIPEHVITRKLIGRRNIRIGHNEVFRFLYDGKQYFAKIYKEERGFQREIYALENFGGADIPVPDIVFKAASYGSGDRSLVITEKIKGTTLDKIKLHRDKYCYEVGRLLARIHSMQIPATMETLVIPVEEIANHVLLFANNENIRHPSLEVIRETLEDLNGSEGIVMSHGDYIGRHIFVFQGVVSGIVDWECLRASRPEIDLGHCSAFLEIFGNPEDERDFIEGYGLTFDEDIKNKLKLYYKIIFARYWKRLKREKEHQRAMHSIRTQPA